MAPNSPACSFIHASMAGSRSTAPLNRSKSVLIVAPFLAGDAPAEADLSRSVNCRRLLAGLACGGGFGCGLGVGRGLAVVVGGRHVALNDEAERFAQLVVNLVANFRVFLEEDARVVATLAQALTFVGNPRAGFFEQAFGYAKINQITLAGDAFAIDDVEFGFAERRGDFVLHDFGAGARANDAVTFLDGLNATNVYADRGIKLQGAAAGGGLRIAEHNADFFANLVDENQAGARLRNDGGELAQRLRH